MYWTMKSDLQKQIKDIQERTSKIINDASSERTNLSHWPSIASFVTESFPEEDLSGLPIYITQAAVLKKNGFEGINGCYIPSVDLILVRVKPNVTAGNPKAQFFKDLHKLIKQPISVEDVVLHESMHAISKRLNRNNRHYTNNEEEFVYANCIKYYKSNHNNRPISDETIVKVILRSFCVNDILEDKQKLSNLFESLRSAKNLDVVPWMVEFTNNELSNFMDLHSDFLAPKIVEEAEKEGQRILDYYTRSWDKPPSNADLFDVGERFQSLDFG